MRTVELPDGKIAEFAANTPDEVLHNFARDYINNNLGKKQSQIPPSSPTTTDFLKENIARPILIAGKNIIQGTVGGVTDLTRLATDPIQRSIANVTGIKALQPSQESTSAAIGRGADILTGGLTAPRDKTERIVQTAGEIVGGGLTGGLAKAGAKMIGTPLKGVTENVANLFSTQNPTELAGLTAAGVTAGTMNENPEGNIAGKIIAPITAGLATQGVIGAARGAGNATKSLYSSITGGGNVTAEQILARRLPKDQTAKLLDELRNAPNDSPLVLADVGGDSMRGLTRSVAKISTSKDLITDALNNRSEKAVERIANYLSKDVSNNQSYLGSIDDLIKSRSDAAAPLYSKAFIDENNKILTLPIKGNEVLFEQIIPDIKEARSTFRISNDLPDNSLEMLDNAKKMLDDKINVAQRAGENQRAKVLLGIKSELVGKMDELSLNYKKARQIFADYSALKNAQEEGLKFSTQTPEALQRVLKGLTQGEKDAYRIGVKEALQNTIQKTADGADPAKRIFGNTFKKKQLQQIFQNEIQYKNFERKMLDEIQAAKTKNTILGGSRTDFNIESDNELIGNIANAALDASQLNTRGLLRATINALQNVGVGLNKKNAVLLAKALIDRKEGIKTLERAFRLQKDPIQKRAIKEILIQISAKQTVPLMGVNSVVQSQQVNDQNN